MSFSLVRIRNFFFEGLIVVFYVLLFAKNNIENEGSLLTLVTATSVLLGAGCSIYFFLKLPDKALSKTLIAIMVVFAWINGILGPNFRYEDIILTFSYFGLALIPIFCKLNPKVFKIATYFAITFFAFQMFEGISPDFVFPRTSRNFISVILLIACSYYFIACFQNNVSPSFLVILLSFACAVYAVGRGGIISFAVLVLFFPFILKIKVKYKVLIASIFVVICIFGYFYFQALLNESGLERFDSMGLESERSSINSDYLHATFQDIRSIFFGPDLTKIPSIVFVELNPHNSFLRLHIYYGFFGFFILFGFLAYTLVYFYTKKYYLYLLLLGVLLLRSFLDSSAFHGPFDPIIFYLIFFAIQNKKLI